MCKKHTADPGEHAQDMDGFEEGVEHGVSIQLLKKSPQHRRKWRLVIVWDCSQKIHRT